MPPEARARHRHAEAGARVAVTDTLASEGRAVAAELGEAAMFIPLDVSDVSQWTDSEEGERNRDHV